ncbi:MAG: hypothetical protein IKW89_10020 [Bacteroidales bacterium]|nr:hypothetical protein [Bacteroidales bacterium]
MKNKFLIASLLMLVSVGMFAQENTSAKKYGFKSAIVKINTVMLGRTIESTAYVDNYGAQTSQVVEMNVPLKGEVKSATIVRDGKSYTVNYTSKKIEVADAIEQPNFLNPTDADKEKYNIKELAEDMVLGKKCVVYALDTDYNGTPATMTVWCYKGYPMKSETDTGIFKVTTEVTSFEENADVPGDVLEIPDYKTKKKK